MDREEGRKEHISGPGCVDGRGYSGHWISLEEMNGCRAAQFLLLNGPDWRPESDDQDFELESQVFLTGIADGSPDLAPLAGLFSVRHASAIVPANQRTSDVSTYMD